MTASPTSSPSVFHSLLVFPAFLAFPVLSLLSLCFSRSPRAFLVLPVLFSLSHVFCFFCSCVSSPSLPRVYPPPVSSSQVCHDGLWPGSVRCAPFPGEVPLLACGWAEHARFSSIQANLGFFDSGQWSKANWPSIRPI